MATLPGGTTVATTGLTTTQLQTLSNVLATQAPAGTTPTQTSLGGSGTPVTTTTLPQTVLLGEATYGSVNSATVVKDTTSTNNLGLVNVNNTDSSAGSGTLTNVVIDTSFNSVVLTGTGNNNTTSVFFDASAGGKVVVGDSGSNFLVLGGSSGTGTGGVNTVVTGIGNDSVIGSATSDNITSNGTSVINGGAGNDSIIGGAGNATLGGGAGNDTIVAGSGGSYIIGEAGNDSLVGGAGNDVFIFSPGDGNDTISGFDPAADTIGFTSTSYTGGTLDLGALISNATVSGGNTILTLPDGSTITVTGLTGANLSWFTSKG